MNTPFACRVAEGDITDRDEEANLGDPDEEANMDDPDEKANIDDPDEKKNRGDPEEKKDFERESLIGSDCHEVLIPVQRTCVYNF